MYDPPAQGLLVDWQMPVFPGGAQVVAEEDEEEEEEEGQHWLLVSPGQ